MTVFRLLLTVLCSIAMLTAGPAPGSIPPDLASYGLEGAVRLSYRDVDAVCERPELAARAQAMLETLEEQDDLLLSFLVDGSVGIGRDALGPYDHLVIVNQAWVDRTDPQAQLTPIELMALSEGMQGLLTDQMPVWTGDGSVLPAGGQAVSIQGERPAGAPGGHGRRPGPGADTASAGPCAGPAGPCDEGVQLSGPPELHRRPAVCGRAALAKGCTGKRAWGPAVGDQYTETAMRD